MALCGERQTLHPRIRCFIRVTQALYCRVSFRLRLLGPPSLDRVTNQHSVVLTAGKPLAILAYLAIRGPVRREELIALLWGDVPEEKARNAFRQALHRLRAAMGPEAAPTGRDVIALPESIAVDLRDFDAAVDDGRIGDVLQLHGGPFLEGLDVGEDDFARWMSAERARIGARFHSTLRAAAQEALDRGEMRDALRYAARLSADAPLDADMAVLEATILIAAGKKPEALATLERFQLRIVEELDAPAPRSVLALIVKLQKPAADDARRAPVRTVLPFVGRESEIAVLMGGWRRAQDGEGGAVVMEGASGIGKTRLVDEFISRVRDMGPALLLRGRERQGGAPIPHASIAEALRAALNAPGLAGASQHLLAEAARLLPELRDQFSLPLSEPLSDDTERVRFFEGVASFVDAVAYEQPVCVVLEDLHNASASTLDLAQYLTNRLRASGVLFVLSARNGTLRDRFSEGSRLTLPALSPEDARTLATAALSAELAPSNALDDIVGRSEGVPLRIIETARRAAAGEPITSIPATIRDILWSRLRGASPAQQRLFVAVALFDRPTSLRLLAAASHLSEIAAFEAAIGLEQLGLAIQDAGGLRPAHDVAESLALEEMGSAGLALLAGWAADALAADVGASDAELAHLYALAGRPERAFTHAVAAAYHACSAAAGASARRFLEIAGSVASTEAERAQISKLRRAMGADAPRIGGPPPVAVPEPVDEIPEEIAVAAPSRPPRRRTTNFARGAALAATLIVAILLLAAVRARGAREASLRGRTLSDTLVLAERVVGERRPLSLITGDLTAPSQLTAPSGAVDASIAWRDSVKRPWVNPSVAPGGRFVSVERVTATGSDLYVLSADKRDTLAVAARAGDNIASGWSPDGRWLLVIRGGTSSDGSYNFGLYAYSMVSPGERIALDTARSRSVSDAVWSPDGLHVAWTARTGANHQQDIFVSRADGTGIRNLSADPGEDYNPAWSPDGSQVGFTSERTGVAQLYAADAVTGHLRRLTYDVSHNDRASYSPNGQFVAFESTRGGEAGVYVMPSWGGTAHRVTPADTRMSIVGWRGAAIPYADRLYIHAPEWVAEGASGAVSVAVTDQRGAPLEAKQVRWTLVDTALAHFARARGDRVVNNLPDTAGWLIGRRSGFARLVATLGGWRSDTAYVRVGAEPLVLASENFERGMSNDQWIPLGQPSPQISPRRGRSGSAGMDPNADREWDSGVLSRSVFSIRSGLALEAWMRAPFIGTAARSASATMALVAQEPREALDSVAPQFLRLVSISWLGDAGRIGYAVDQEVFTEPATALGDGAAHMFRFLIEADGRVAFFADGALRWRSSVRATRPVPNSAAQLGLGGRSTAGEVTFDDVRIWLAGK